MNGHLVLLILLVWCVIGVWVVNEHLDIEERFVVYTQVHPVLGIIAYVLTLTLWPLALLARKLGKV